MLGWNQVHTVDQCAGKHPSHHYPTTTTSSSLKHWCMSVWICIFMLFKPNSDPSIWVCKIWDSSEQASLLLSNSGEQPIASSFLFLTDRSGTQCGAHVLCSEMLFCIRWLQHCMRRSYLWLSISSKQSRYSLWHLASTRHSHPGNSWILSQSFETCKMHLWYCIDACLYTIK